VTSRRAALALASLLATACSSDDSSASHDSGASDDATPGTSDAADGSDGGPLADAGGCRARDLDPAWLEDYEHEIVAKLSGAAPIATGVTLSDRASSTAREHVRVYLVNELTAMGYAPLRHNYEGGAANVVARLSSGRADARVVVLGGHFDGVANVPAAADDGTGTALVLAAARWYADLDCRQHDVIFAFFDQEENGLIGSNFYSAKLKSDGEDVLAVHIFDMISFDGDGDQVVELWMPSPGMADLYEAAGAPLGVHTSVAPRFSSSDHTSFLDDGFVTTGVSEEFVGGDHTPHYHKVTDTLDKVNFGYLGLVTRVALAASSHQVAPDAP